MSEKDGGPAFPTEPNTQPGRYAHHGMTLRDYFAGQAIAGLMSGLGSSMEWPSHQQIKSAAGYSYQVADALLKARTQGES